MAKKNYKEDTMISNVVIDESPIFPEDMTAEPLFVEPVQVAPVVTKKSGLTVGSQVKIVTSSFKNIIGQIATIVDLVDGDFIVDVSGGKYQFAASDIAKV